MDMGDVIPWGVYHYSGLPHVSWYEFAKTIFNEAGSQGAIASQPILKGINSSAYQASAKRPANSKLDCRKIEQMFGIKPCDWSAALQSVKEYI